MKIKLLSLKEVRAVLDDIRCSVGGIAWNVSVDEVGGDYVLQLHYMDKDIFNGKLEEQHTRRWIIARRSTPSQIAQTVLKACLTSAEHMVREHFTYQDVRVFSPHLDIQKLVTMLSADRPESVAGDSTPPVHLGYEPTLPVRDLPRLQAPPDPWV